MSFQNFSFPQITQDFGLTLNDADLFSAATPAVIKPGLLDQLIEAVDLANAINTEKARSEFVIAPILLEWRRMHAGKFSLFSGIELNADLARGLNGVCDFIVSRSLSQHVLVAPLIAIVEAKNDNLRTGLGQCIAAMLGAQLVNKDSPNNPSSVFGVVTTGSAWKFLRLHKTCLTLDIHEYRIERLDKILGILNYILQS